MSYLIHFNKNHDKKNGRFTYGDGDGDGTSNDHAHRIAYKVKDNLSSYDVGSKYGERRETGKSSKESDSLAILAGEKYRSLYTVNRTKEVAERSLATDPKKFKNSQERKDYTDAVMYASDSFDNANRFIKQMSKKYKTIDYDVKSEEKTGESYIRAILEDKNSNQYITEMYLGTHVKN